MIAQVIKAAAVDTKNAYPDSLSRLIASLQEETLLTPEAVKQLVLNAKISAKDLMPWSDFNHPIDDSYGRKLVHFGGHFEVMVMSWMPGDFSAIHDHGATQWGAVQCFGSAQHYIYQFEDGLLSDLEPAHYSPEMVHAVGHRLIHQMGNPGNQPFLSLHVYGVMEPGQTITGNARVFDLWENRIQYTDGGVFFCLPEAQINDRGAALRADRATQQRHHRLMGDRIERILAAGQQPQLAKQLAGLRAQMAD